MVKGLNILGKYDICTRRRIMILPKYQNEEDREPGVILCHIAEKKKLVITP